MTSLAEERGEGMGCHAGRTGVEIDYICRSTELITLLIVLSVVASSACFCPSCLLGAEFGMRSAMFKLFATSDYKILLKGTQIFLLDVSTSDFW